MFWERCQRLGIEDEFRAKFQERKRTRDANEPARIAERLRRDDELTRRRVIDHVEQSLEALSRGVREAPALEPPGTFDEWFWERCRRLGIEEELRAKFAEWKQSRQASDRP